MTNAAQLLAQWVEAEHPDFFTHLHAGITRANMERKTRRASLNGLGDYTDDFSDPVDISSTQVDLTGGSSGGFLDSIGSGIADAATSVGGWLTSGGGLNSLANLGAAYFKTQQTAQTAQMQTAVLQAQVARAQAGMPPAPVSYVQNSAGQVVPVYTGSVNTYPALQSAIGAGQSQYINTAGVAGYTVPPNMVSTLGPGISTQNILPWALLGLGVFVLAKVL